MADYVRHLRDVVGGQELLQIPSAAVALRDGDGRVLLARHSEGNVWVLPGGAVEPAETPADAAVREMFEETGLLVRLTGLIGVFGGPAFVVSYRNGHRTSYVMSLFEAEIAGGRVRPDSTEVLEVRYVSERDAGRLHKAPWLAEVLTAVFERNRNAAFKPATWRPSNW
jgi:8-oxo-dGTP pyrophosphatase MutT (NUDIX family)